MEFAQIETAIRDRMEAKRIHEDVIKEYVRRVRLVSEGYSGKIPWQEIKDPRPGDLMELGDLKAPKDPQKYLKHLVVIKLNGGLGTSMGLTRAKSVIPVKGDLTFLEVMLQQIQSLRDRFKIDLPLIFMNSFNTREDTLEVAGIADVNKNTGKNLPPDFLQNMVPRIKKSDLLPPGDGNDPSQWCPPGHGDIYLSMKITGLLDQLIEIGYTTAFISNADNLAADVDERILARFIDDNLDFAMEITHKTLADIKGGVLIRHEKNGHSRVELLEAAQVEDSHMDDFINIDRFAYFNTNNLWVNLESLRDRLNSPDGVPLSVIVNPKEVNGADVLQLETAMGAAIGHFARAKGIIIPRDRFAPVKNCSDLLVRRSDAYTLDEITGALLRATDSEVVVKLDDNYKKIEDFDRLFKEIPSIIGAKSLSVSGQVLFDRKVTIEGDVTIKNAGSDVKKISSVERDSFHNEEIIL